MIPKKIHYCWFGHNPLPQSVIKCINSWKEKLPEYEIKEWNENNFDVNSLNYTKEAYSKQKYAFVADVARLYALYNEGGIYLDTDVEVLNSFDIFLHHKAFIGFENETMIATCVMASEKRGLWTKEILDSYSLLHFINDNGSLNTVTNVVLITKYMINKGLKQDNTYQDFPNFVTVYPKDFFSPKSHETGQIRLTNNSITIHHFAESWYGRKEKLFRLISKIIGFSLACKISSIYKHMRASLFKQ